MNPKTTEPTTSSLVKMESPLSVLSPEQAGLIEGLGLTEQHVIDSYIYIFARYLVLRQEHIDISEEGVDYNVIKYNELSKADFVNPNLDVAYLEAWFAVDEDTPVILEIPKIQDRYYTAQLVDEWAEIITNINERNYPKRPYGRYALCLKGSNPKIPKETLRIDLPSNKAKMLARVERKGDDQSAVQLQREFKIIKVGDPKIENAVRIPMFANQKPLLVEVFEKPMVEEVLKSAPDSNTQSIHYQKNVLAIADFISKSQENTALIQSILKEKAFPEMIDYIKNFGDRKGGWSCTREQLNFGDNIWFRCGANYAGIWWNSSSEVVYYIGEKDSDGNPLNGDKTYVIHYKKEDEPQKHVNAYWSLTLLSLPDYRVVPNDLNRYNLNNISKLTYEQDGSLKIYIAGRIGTEVPSSNWLPAPEGKRFSLNHRFYVPNNDVLSGEWYVPSIQNIE